MHRDAFLKDPAGCRKALGGSEEVSEARAFEQELRGPIRQEAVSGKVKAEGSGEAEGSAEAEGSGEGETASEFWAIRGPVFRSIPIGAGAAMQEPEKRKAYSPTAYGLAKKEFFAALLGLGVFAFCFKTFHSLFQELPLHSHCI